MFVYLLIIKTSTNFLEKYHCFLNEKVFLVYGNSNSVRSIHGIFLCLSHYDICIIDNRFPLFVWKNGTYFYSPMMLFNQFRRHFYWAISHAYYFIFKFFVIKYLLENNKTLILFYLCKFFLNGSIKHFYCIKYYKEKNNYVYFIKILLRCFDI